MTDHFVLAQCLISLIFLAVIWFYLFAKLRRDNFRSRIRHIRDELFDYMWQNGHSFDNEEYRKTRQMLNGLIRMSRTFTPASLFLDLIFTVLQSRLGANKQVIDEEPKDDLGKKLRETQLEAAKQTLRFVYYQGLMGLFLRCLIWLLRITRLPFAAKDWALRTAENFLSRAYEVGSPSFGVSHFTRFSGAK